MSVSVFLKRLCKNKPQNARMPVNNPTCVVVGDEVRFVYICSGVLVSRQTSQRSEETCACPHHAQIFVCETWWWGLPVMKSSVCADQDPVSQAARE